MRRRQPPTVLLYGIGLALLLSLGFNSFLLIDQRTRPEQRPYPDTLQAGTASARMEALNEQLQGCIRANHQKDSLIQALEQVSHASR